MIDKTELKKIARKLYGLLERKQKRNFIIILLAMAASACLSQVTPKAIGWLTDDILVQTQIQFTKIIPILLLILVVNVVNEWIKILRRIMVEDTATATEKKARGIVITSLLKAPLAFYKENMTGNIHGRLNRCLDGTIRLVKLVFMDFAPAIFNSIAAIVVIFMTLPPILAFPMLFVIPIGVAIVMRQISTQRGIRVELLDKKASMDGAIVELLNGIEVIRVADSISAEESRFDRKSEALRSKEMKHHVQMAKYDCLKFINEVVFTVLMIGISAYLAAQGVISVGAVLTAYLCFMQLIRPLEELHRILDELSEGMILAEDFFKMAEIENDFSYAEIEPRAEPREKLPGILEIQNLWFSYDDHKPILKGISLSIEKGMFLGVAGPSGCGKSSLIKAICKLENCRGDICTHSEKGGQPPMNEKLEKLNQEIEKTEKKLRRAQNEDEFFKRRVGYGLSIRRRYEGRNPCGAERNRAVYP